MQYFYRSTQVPNEIFDNYLPYLNQAQLKVLLVVIRQTLGWIDPKTKKRKDKDWISISFFSKRTKLTHKSISMAISQLIYKELIVALDHYGRELRDPKDRRGKKRIYYAYAPQYRALKNKSKVDMLTKVFTFRPKTKQTHTKQNRIATRTFHYRQSDIERYQDILRGQKQDVDNP